VPIAFIASVGGVEDILELHARGRKDFKAELADAFCRTVLGPDGLPGQNGKGRFNLSVFKDQHFRFVTDPADRVEAVQVRQLDLALRRDPWKRVSLSAAPSRGYPRPVYELLEHVTARDELALDALEVTKAKLRLVFVPDDDGRGKGLTFEVGWPDRCTLRDGRYDQVARRCLKRWGVDCA